MILLLLLLLLFIIIVIIIDDIVNRRGGLQGRLEAGGLHRVLLLRRQRQVHRGVRARGLPQRRRELRGPPQQRGLLVQRSGPRPLGLLRDGGRRKLN